MRDARVVTIVGPGGVGKTRLAIETANALAGRFGQGARLVELAGLRDPAAVGPALTGALGLTSTGGRAQDALARPDTVTAGALASAAVRAVTAGFGAVDAATLAPTFGAEAARLAVVRDWVFSALGEALAQRLRAIGAARSVAQAADAALEHLAKLR